MLAKAGWEMPGFNHRPFAPDHRALQGVAQLAHVARPGVIVELVQYRFADGRTGKAVNDDAFVCLGNRG